jgi:hypothetical protein
MDDKQFWRIIEAGGSKALKDEDRQLAAVNKELGKLLPDELVAFQRLFTEKLAEAYIWDLWGAAYLINGGCSDDGFHYFCGWLISRGRAVYEAALANPDSLAGLTEHSRNDYEFESLGYAPLEIYKQLTGKEMAPKRYPWPKQPKGRRWDFEDDEQAKKRLPKLAKIYCE